MVAVAVWLAPFTALTLAGCKTTTPGQAPHGRTVPAAAMSAPADNLIAAERASMAVEDQQRAETALNGERSVRPHRDSPLRRTIRRRSQP